MTLSFKDKIIQLARQHCELNSWEWPDDLDGEPLGFDKLQNIDEMHDVIHPIMENIEEEIYSLTHIDPWLITNYYWNCYYNGKQTAEDWLDWIFFGKIRDIYIKEKEVAGYLMNWRK